VEHGGLAVDLRAVQSSHRKRYTRTMGITKTDHQTHATETFFRGRVLQVEKTTESRNWSDTLDYTDFRSTECTWALVYIGIHGVAPHSRVGRTITYHAPPPWETPRDLEAGERFAWVDCTNLFADRNGYRLEAEVDTVGDLLIAGGVENIYDQLAAWEAHHAAVRAANLAEQGRIAARRAEEEKIRREREEIRLAKKQAKDAAGKAAAEALLPKIPAKGTVVTVDGFTGKVFWIGVNKYRGVWSAKAGVKDSRGDVRWVDSSKF